ncbi:MAG: transglycosylase SLT domain-containing protein [Kineosporiaceae bacterium]
MPRYSAEQIYAYALEAGFDPHSATTMTAIAMAESRGNSDAHATHGEDSRGLWQVNARAHPELARRFDLWDPADNARAAFEVSRGGHDVSPWTTTHGGTRASYVRFRSDAQAAAVAHGEPPGLGVWTGTRGYGHHLAASPDVDGPAPSRGEPPRPHPAPEATTAPAPADGAQPGVVDVVPAPTAGEQAPGGPEAVPLVAVTPADAQAPAGPATGVSTAPAPDLPGQGHAPAVELVTELPADHVVALDEALPQAPAPAARLVRHDPDPVLLAPAAAPAHVEPAVVQVAAAAPAPLTQPVAPPPEPHPEPQPHPAAPAAHPAAHSTGAHDAGALDAFMDAATAQKGDAYVMGAQARFSDPNPSVFDCAELVRWSAHRAGVSMPDGSWLQYLHLKEAGALIPVEEAKHTRGALLFSFSSEPVPGGARPSHSHVAISDGHGHTVEARGRAYGVGSWEAGRRFDYAAVIPGLDGGDAPAQPSPPPSPAAAPGGAPASGVQLSAPLSAAPPVLGGAVIDTDRDGLDDALERSLGTDPHAVDTDRDGLRDSRELLYTHTDPLVADPAADRFDAVLDAAPAEDHAVVDHADHGLRDGVTLDHAIGVHEGGSPAEHAADGATHGGHQDGHPGGHDQGVHADGSHSDGTHPDGHPGHAGPATGVALDHPLGQADQAWSGPEPGAHGHPSDHGGGDHGGHGW